jgi:hypothetical protein
METMSSARIVSDAAHGIATVNPQPGRLKLPGLGKNKSANKNAKSAKGANDSSRAPIQSDAMVLRSENRQEADVRGRDGVGAQYFSGPVFGGSA